MLLPNNGIGLGVDRGVGALRHDKAKGRLKTILFQSHGAPRNRCLPLLRQRRRPATWRSVQLPWEPTRVAADLLKQEPHCFHGGVAPAAFCHSLGNPSEHAVLRAVVEVAPSLTQAPSLGFHPRREAAPWSLAPSALKDRLLTDRHGLSRTATRSQILCIGLSDQAPANFKFCFDPV